MSTTMFSPGPACFANRSIIIIPQYNLPVITSVSYDIAMRLYQVYRGTEIAVVVVNNPLGVMSATRKAWLRLVRQLRSNKSQTLDSVRINELSREISRMESMPFTIGPPTDGMGVVFIEPEILSDVVRELAS